MRTTRDHEGRKTVGVLWGVIATLVIVTAVLMVGVLPWAVWHLGHACGSGRRSPINVPRIQDAGR